MGLRRRKQKPGKSLMAFAWYTGGSMSVPVTKFSLRMYGSRKGVEQEQERQEKVGPFVIHPYSNFRFYWDFVSLILLIISMIIIPVAITFFNEKMTSDPGWVAFNLALDFWFLTDIIINFHTGIIVEYGDGDVILNLRRIRISYLRTWFLVDLISTIPIDYILQLSNGVSASASASRAMKLFRFAKMLSLLRLLRISRLIRYVHQWEEIVNMQYDLAVAAVRIFNLVCLMLLIGHWNGCLQYLVPMLYDFPEDSWVIVDKLQNASWGEKYSWSLFKAMSHMLCIGYGQQPPKNLMDLWMTMISMVSGAVCFAMFIGHTTALIQSLDSSKRQYKEKYMQVKEYMRYRRLPKSLRMRVYDYYENRFQGKMFDEQGILAEISPTLQEEIVNFNCRYLVAAVPFFRNADQDFVTEVVQKLQYEVFQPNDMIVKEGSVGNKMYFMQHGIVEIRSARNLNRTQLSDGSYFGEICLLTNQRRVASVFAVTNCCLYSLHVDDFNELLSRYPIMRRTLETVAAKRLSKIGKYSSVLDRRVKECRNLDPTSTEIAQEIEKHDERNSDKSHLHHATSTSKIQNFRQNNISSPNKKYQAYFRSYCADSEIAPLNTSVTDTRATEMPSDYLKGIEGFPIRKSMEGSRSNQTKKRTLNFIQRFFQNDKNYKKGIYKRPAVSANGFVASSSEYTAETELVTNLFAENVIEDSPGQVEIIPEVRFTPIVNHHCTNDILKSKSTSKSSTEKVKDNQVCTVTLECTSVEDDKEPDQNIDVLPKPREKIFRKTSITITNDADDIAKDQNCHENENKEIKEILANKNQCRNNLSDGNLSEDSSKYDSTEVKPVRLKHACSAPDFESHFRGLTPLEQQRGSLPPSVQNGCIHTLKPEARGKKAIYKSEGDLV